MPPRISLLILSVFLFAPLDAQNKDSTSPARGLLVVVNQKEHTVLLVDPGKKIAVARFTVGVNGHEAVVSKDSRFAYVPIYGNSGVGKPGTDGATVDIIDLRDRKLAGSIDLDKPLRPHCAKFGPDGLLYVTAELTNAVDLIDPSSRQVIAEIPTGQEQSHMLVLSPDGRRAYTSNVSAGSVSVLDLTKRGLVTFIPVAKKLQRLSISTDGRRVFTHDQDQPRLAVIDTSTNKITDWIGLPDVAYASTPTPDGRWLLLVGMQANRIHVLDLQSMKIVRSFDVPQMPSETLVSPDGRFAYISCVGAGKLAVLDLHSWQMQEPIPLTPGVDGLAWVPNSD